jgi:hypothetical protein
MNDSRIRHQDVASDTGFGSGLAIGLLVAIPLWMLIGIALLTAFQQTLNGFAGVALTVAAACEALLARYALRHAWQQYWRRWFPVFDRAAWNSARERKRTVSGLARTRYGA